MIGDLNASPFAPGIAGVYGLNGTAIRSEALKNERTVEGKSYRYFYNPMWRFLGLEGTRDDHGNFRGKNNETKSIHTVPGTFFYSNYVKPVWHGWYVLDQVLVRSSLVNKIRDIVIPRSDGITSFVTSHDHRPRKDISDHLPLILKINC